MRYWSILERKKVEAREKKKNPRTYKDTEHEIVIDLQFFEGSKQNPSRQAGRMSAIPLERKSERNWLEAVGTTYVLHKTTNVARPKRIQDSTASVAAALIPMM